MATKKDLVEAYSFSRRRLVTAFVSGAPGGREVEPARPGRAVIGGIAIAVLLLAGAVILGILGSPVELDETKPQLLSEKESGADYVLISTGDSEELELRPVINITSAMLLLGDDIEPFVVPRDELSELTPGEQIGILQAPATPPPVDNLLPGGWTACTGTVDGAPVGVRLDVARDPAVEPTPDVGFVVRAVGGEQESLYLVAESTRGTLDGRPRAHAYEVPEAEATRILSGVASSSVADATPVPAAWLTTFPPGGALDLGSFGLTARDVGRPFPGRTADGPLAQARVGDVLETDAQRYLLTAEGAALPLDGFAAAVYQGLAPEGREPLSVSGTVPGDLEVLDRTLLDSTRWPLEPTTEQPAGELCSLLGTAPGEAPSVTLARAEPGGTASAEGVEPGERVATVVAGAGAFVRSGGWSDTQATTRVLVDDRGFAYPVAGEAEQERLGYAGVAEQVVPDSWVELLVPGVPLSVADARCPPTSQQRSGPCG
jgi:hypothetical protein